MLRFQQICNIRKLIFRTLVQLLERTKKKYQSRLKRLEQQMVNMSERHAMQVYREKLRVIKCDRHKNVMWLSGSRPKATSYGAGRWVFRPPFTFKFSPKWDFPMILPFFFTLLWITLCCTHTLLLVFNCVIYKIRTCYLPFIRQANLKVHDFILFCFVLFPYNQIFLVVTYWKSRMNQFTVAVYYPNSIK